MAPYGPSALGHAARMRRPRPCAPAREEEESHEADRRGHARKEKERFAGGLDRGEKEEKGLGRLGRKEKAQVWPAGFWIFQKEKSAEEKDFWRGFGKKGKTHKICVELRAIFLILQNWFEPI